MESRSAVRTVGGLHPISARSNGVSLRAAAVARRRRLARGRRDRLHGDLGSRAQVVEYNLHYGPDNWWEHAEIPIDATAWHSWAVEWTPEHITAYVDGNPWWTSTDPMTFPPRPMHLCIQLDNFGGDTSSGGRQTVDWVRRYPLT